MPILVRDLGHSELGHQEREGILGKDSNPDTIEGIVQMLKYQNPSQVIEGIHAKVAELQPQLDAAGRAHRALHRPRRTSSNATIDKVGHTMVEGIGLVCMVLILFLGSPRSALVVAVTIPLAMVTVFVADEPDPHVGQHAVAGRHRFRHHRRRRHRGDRGDSAPARGQARPRR